jgi:hypothetical protein
MRRVRGGLGNCVRKFPDCAEFLELSLLETNVELLVYQAEQIHQVEAVDRQIGQLGVRAGGPKRPGHP